MHGVSPITSNGNTPSSAGFLSKGFTLKGGRNSIDGLDPEGSSKSFTKKTMNASQDLQFLSKMNQPDNKPIF